MWPWWLYLLVGALLGLAAVLSRERRAFPAVVVDRVRGVDPCVPCAMHPTFQVHPVWILVVIDPETRRPLDVEATPAVWARAEVGRVVKVSCDWLARCSACILPPGEKDVPALPAA